MNQAPNIFAFATSELSQDAFFAWLVSWADEQQAQRSPYLHITARRFVAWLYDRSGRQPPAYTSVAAIRQRKHVDLLVKLSGPEIEDHYVLIEDKTYTSDHATQITGYIEALRSDGIRSDILPVYIKTWVEERKAGNHTRLYLPDIIDFIETIDLEKASSEILSSWCMMMKVAHGELMLFKSLPMLDWSETQWMGCFHHIANQPEVIPLEPGFGYVPNASGGFMGCWMGWQEKPKAYYIYLQVNANAGRMPKGTFRIGAANGEKVDKELAKRMQVVMTGVAEQKRYAISPRGGIRIGKSSCFAVLETTPFVDQTKGTFDLPLAMDQIRDWHWMLAECARRMDLSG